MTEPTRHADLVAARARLTKASDAWLAAEESGELPQEIVDEYYHAYDALVSLNDARLYEALERTDGR